jgi:hypothetical protein
METPGPARSHDPMVPGSSDRRNSSAESARLATGCLIPLVVLCYLGYRLTNPSDWVEITILGIPDGSKSIHLIAETPEGLAVIPPYHSKVLPFAGHRREGLAQGPLAVAWREADRYAMLIQSAEGAWSLRRVGSGEIRRPSAWRYLVGGSTAVIRVSEGDPPRAQSAEDVDRLLGPDPFAAISPATRHPALK